MLVNDMDGVTLDYFIDDEIWDEIGKKLEDFSEEDMMKLSFTSLKACLQFYELYAKAKGFGIRKIGANKSRVDNHPTSQRFVCNKQGYRLQKWVNLKNRKRTPKSITRCGCGAGIRFKLGPDSKSWFVTEFREKHNHVLAMSIHVSFIRNNRKIKPGDQMRITTLFKSGMNPSSIMRNLVEEYGSHENVGFLMKDLQNFWERIKHQEVNGGDAETVLAYLCGKQILDPSYYIDYTCDTKNRLQKLFWCDGISRSDYKIFGHVIAFDTTYKSNTYNKPLVVIVGVNNHRKIIPFGCALVVDETEESFIWVLNQLILAGNGKKPHTVLTDGDKAMANAIKVVVPEARHRLCLWHLMRNVKTNGGKDFTRGFMKCVDKCRRPDEFEEAWKELVTSHGVQYRKWAIELYKDKEKWAEAFMRGFFYAGMRSTQRCESMHKTVKRVLDSKIKLYRFVELYEKVLAEIRFNDRHLDHISLNSEVQVEGVLSNIKKHAAQVYTRNSYNFLLKELEFEKYFAVRDVKEDTSNAQGTVTYYSLEDTEIQTSWYLVIHVSALERMYCCCMKLESVGYPCRHMFAVMKDQRMTQIPKGCILKRWTIHAKEHIIADEPKDEFEGEDESVVMARYSYLYSAFIKLCHGAALSLGDFDQLKNTFAKLMLRYAGSSAKRSMKKPQKRQRLGVDDPEVITSRGQPKKRKVRGKLHENEKLMECDTSKSVEDDNPNSKPTTSTVVRDFDLNVPPETSSPTKTTNEAKIDTESPFYAMLKERMPKTCFFRKMLQDEYSYEVKNLDEDPIVVDWDPSKSW